MDVLNGILKRGMQVGPMLAAIRSGAVIRGTVGWMVQTGAVLAGLWMLRIWAGMWGLCENLSMLGLAALAVWQVAFLYATFLALAVLFVRGREIRKSPPCDYTVIPIMANLLRTSGEMTFLFMAIISIPAGLFVWLGGSILLYDYPALDAGSVFVSGLLAFGLPLFVGFLALLATQFLAEWTLALFSLAADVNVLRRRLVPDNAPSA